MRIALIAVVGLLALSGAANAYADDLTPSGPAELINRFPIPPMPAPPPGHSYTRVLTAWTATVVTDGGQAGVVRPVISGSNGIVLGDPVTLPADPGTYSFGVTPVDGDVIGIEQQTGQHAILSPQQCQRCYSVDVFAGDPPSFTATGNLPGEQLTVAGVSKPDEDGDRIPDDVDRTDLRLTAAPPTVDPDGRQRIRLTIANAGPLTANTPVISTPSLSGIEHEWALPCFTYAYVYSLDDKRNGVQCTTPSIPAGGSISIDLLLDVKQAAGAVLTVAAEGADLKAGDNAVTLHLAPTPAAGIAAAAKQRLARGIAATVTLGRPGSAKLTARFTIRHRHVTISRTIKLVAGKPTRVTLRPHGAALRTLRRAVKRGALHGTLAVGKASVAVSLRR